MTTRKTLAGLVIALITLSPLVACGPSKMAAIKERQSLHRGVISNKNLGLQHQAKCIEKSRELGVPIESLEDCRNYEDAGGYQQQGRQQFPLLGHTQSMMVLPDPGPRRRRELGLPLVKPLPHGQAFSPVAYGAALRGARSGVQMNCSASAHAAAYQLLLHDASPTNLPILMESMDVRPLPPGATLRVVGLDAQTCEPFVYERSVRPGEMGLWSTNIQDFIGSASCGNPLEIVAPTVSVQREFVRYEGNGTPWISETGDGLDWTTAYRDCPDESSCGQWHRTGRAGMYSVAAVAGAALLPEHKSVQKIITNTRVNGGSSPTQPPGGPAPPGPDPPGGQPEQPAPDPPGPANPNN